MNDFDYDCYQKKLIARSARNRKCGSKSKHCSASTDHMTHKQWKERNGTVMSFNLSAPMKWADFRQMSSSSQHEYVETLVKNGANVKAMADMFGVSQTSVRKLVPDLTRFKFHSGRQSAEEIAKWTSFLAGPQPAEEYTPEPTEISEPITQPIAVPISEQSAPDAGSHCETCGEIEECSKPAEPKKSMGMTQFNLTFRGEMDEEMIANSLRAMSMMLTGKSGALRISFMSDSDTDSDACFGW